MLCLGDGTSALTQSLPYSFCHLFSGQLGLCQFFSMELFKDDKKMSAQKTESTVTA